MVSTYGKTATNERLAENWELSAHPQGGSAIASGPLAGISFADFARRFPEQSGTALADRPDFPILVKLIDAADTLSIQVHPNDAYAQVTEGEAGKTEAWIVLDCEPGAYLYLGFARSTTRKEVRR